MDSGCLVNIKCWCILPLNVLAGADTKQCNKKGNIIRQQLNNKTLGDFDLPQSFIHSKKPQNTSLFFISVVEASLLLVSV